MLVEEAEVALVLLEERTGQDVAQEQHDADDLVGLDTPRDDAFGQVPCVVLQRLDAAGLEHLDVVVVDRRGLSGHLLRGHRLEQVGVADAGSPLVAQLRAVLPQVCHQLGQQLVATRRRLDLLRLSCVSSSWFMLVPFLSNHLVMRHGGAVSRLGHDVELVHEPSGSGQPEPQPVVRAETVLEGELDVSDAGAGVACHHADPGPRPARAARWSPRRSLANRTMFRATSETAVASMVRSVPEKPARTASSRAAWRAATMSGSALIATWISLSRSGPRPSRGWLSRAQRSHSSRCLPASTSRWRRRSALDSASSTGRHSVGRGLGVLEGQEVLDPQAGPGSASAGRRPRRRCCPSPRPGAAWPAH